MAKNRRIRAIIAAACACALAAFIAIALAAAGGARAGEAAAVDAEARTDPAAPEGADPGSRDAAEAGEPGAGSVADEPPSDAGDTGEAGGEAVDASGAAPAGQPSSYEPEQAEQPGSPPTSPQAEKRRWVVDYKEVWVPKVETVVDVPAHEEPAYGTRDVLVCNACGYRTESSGSMGSHLSEHAVKGVDEGYTSLSEKVQTGTVSVPAQTHEVDNGRYEKVEAGGHWE